MDCYYFYYYYFIFIRHTTLRSQLSLQNKEVHGSIVAQWLYDSLGFLPESKSMRFKVIGRLKLTLSVNELVMLVLKVLHTVIMGEYFSLPSHSWDRLPSDCAWPCVLQKGGNVGWKNSPSINTHLASAILSCVINAAPWWLFACCKRSSSGDKLVHVSHKAV